MTSADIGGVFEAIRLGLLESDARLVALEAQVAKQHELIGFLTEKAMKDGERIAALEGRTA